MKKFIALIAMLSVGAAHAGTISLGSTWTTNGAATALAGESATGYTVTQTANTQVYQDSGLGDAFDVGKTINMSFTVTVGADNGPTKRVGEAFRFGLMDSGSGASIAARLDWDNPAGTTMILGYKPSGTAITVIGSFTDGGSTGSTAIPTGEVLGYEGWSKKLDTEDVLLSITRTGSDSYTTFMDWGDVSVTNNIASGLTFDSIDAIGFKLDSDPTRTNEYTLSNLSVSVIPEPATLGLVAMVGVGLIAIRRTFLV
ncbi:PEP-CTERM sorting domain-containing protein [Pontiella sulfatireligans]|uniref:PEP-CTERM protein-sorting domain-containing protein n=1 Tax=Pontiella sulfatireligans TaxID=2750658 RepID=A0A6C2UEV0_9BACT|nr:PEP-CTERM sorting domain-containing protein [Pontiella sulfatireligans]VGO18638.1 hypothetical protein SCARR_00691 [Pontiella sulfatireligans]